MVQKKVLLLGTSGVGKTSLVSRFVRSMFSEKYLTTVGVKVDKKTVQVAGEEVALMIWDLAGEDDFRHLATSYFRGTSGYLLVADGTRASTVDILGDLQQRVIAVTGPIPFEFLINKSDLAAQWKISDERIAKLTAQGWNPIRTSAKFGEGVEEAFMHLTQQMIASP